MSLRKKLLFTILACVLMITLSAVLGFHIVLQRYNRSLYTQSANLNNLYFSILSDELAQLNTSSGDMATHQTVQALLLHEKTDGSTLDEVRRYLGQAITNRITGIFLYDQKEMRVAVGNTGVNSATLSAFVDQVSSNSSSCWASAGTKDGALLMGRKVLSSQPSSFMQGIGVLVLRINIAQVLLPSTQYAMQWDKHCYIALFHENRQVYPIGGQGTASALPDISPEQYHILTINDQAYFVTTNTMDAGDGSWKLYFGLPYSDILGQITLSRRLLLTLTLLAALLAFAITALIVHRFTQNYTLLADKMERFKRGEYHPQTVAGRNTGDELIRLNRTFDEMAVSYERMTRENYEKQLLLMQAKLKSLEKQLDPHFLFNTLETINFFAKRCGEKNIPQIVNALAELLQYSLQEKGDCVPLRQEISMLEKYLYIQQLRFSDILTVDYAFSEQTMEAMIPKMTLQPLVENAIRYTLDEEESCELRHCSRLEGTDVLIWIADNGPALEADLLTKLKSGEKQPHGSGIGLQNVDTRHKLLFGEKYGLSFGTIDGWATVIVRIPADWKGGAAPHVQNDPG